MAVTAVSAAATAVVTVAVAVSTVATAFASATGRLTVAVEVSEAAETAACSGAIGSSACAASCVTDKYRTDARNSSTISRSFLMASLLL